MKDVFIRPFLKWPGRKYNILAILQQYISLYEKKCHTLVEPFIGSGAVFLNTNYKNYYDLPGVPFDMYFDSDGKAIHGAYWHNNFGVPMSHGCVNLSIPDAEWAYNFASVGTVVNVHD